MRGAVVVLGSIVLATSAYVATFGLWLDDDVTDEEAFVASAMTSFTAEGSYAALGEVIAGKVIERFPDLAPLELALQPLLTAVIATEPFEPALEDVSRQVHDVVFEGSPGAVIVDLADYEDDVMTSLEAVSPDLAARVPTAVFTTFTIFDAGELPDASTASTRIVAAGWAALVIAIALVIVLIVFMRDGLRSFAAIGAALVAGALAVAAIIPLARNVARDTLEREPYRVLAENLYDELVSTLSSRVWLVGLTGAAMLVIAVFGSGLRNRSRPG